jgi:spore coat polysaccharide biosynthesis protein SpsF
MNGIRLMLNFFAFIQARTTSTRFPKKVLQLLNGKNLIETIVYRLEKIIPKDRIVLLIPKGDAELIEVAKKIKISFFEGSEENVRERYIQAAEKFKAENIIRLTADNPFIDIGYIELLCMGFYNSNIDIMSFQNLPIGMGVEVFKASSLRKNPSGEMKKEYDEHVSLHLKVSDEFKFVKLNSFIGAEDFSLVKKIRLTLDTKEDYEVCTLLNAELKENPLFTVDDVIRVYKAKASIFLINESIEQVQFQTFPSEKKANTIFIQYANPLPNGRGHFERCKILSVLLESNGFSVDMSPEFPKEKKYSFYVIDSRDTEVPEFLKNSKLLLIDNFGPDRYLYPHFDSLPNMFNDFESTLENALLPMQIDSIPEKISKTVLCYAGALSFRESYRLDLFLLAHFEPSEYRIIRVGGQKRKRKQHPIEFMENLTKTEYLNLLAEAEFFISYFGQSVMEASFFQKKIILFSISNYHDELAFHFVQNSNAMYAGKLHQNKLNHTANLQKYTRAIDLGLGSKGFPKLVKLILEYMSFI